MDALSEPAVRADRLIKVYKTATAVAGISFELPRGSITGLLGGNGAGKTTTIAMLMGLVAPTAAYSVLGARHAGRALPGAAPHEFRKSVCGDADAAHHPAEPQDVRCALRRADISERIAQLAEELDLNDLLDRPTGKLSAGQKTRVSLAKALINRPDLLLLDEPTASLDPDTADWIRGRLERFRDEHGATMLMASHNMVEVERLCERVIFMKKGGSRTTQAGTAAARFGRTTLEEVFLDVARGTGRTREAAQ